MHTLSEGELLDLCKTPQKTRQLRILRGMGLNPGVRPDGSIIVTSEAVTAALLGQNDPGRQEGEGVNLHAI